MIPQHLKPSMVFTPAAPPKRATPQEEGVPLHRIDRQLWPGMRTVRYDGQAKPQAEWAAERMDSVSPVPDPNLNPTPNLNPAPPAATAPASTVFDDFSSVATDDTARTNEDVYPTEQRTPLPECVTSRSKKTLPECFALATSRPKRRSPTAKEREVMLETLLEREMPADEPQSPADEGGKTRTGRPPKIVGQRRKFLLHALGLGLSRSEVARRLEISPATITKLLQRDAELAAEVTAAERDGANFRRIYAKIFLRGCFVLARRPQLGTLYFEQEKEYLIAKGLPAGWVRRLRARDLEEWSAELDAEKAREKAQVRVEKEYAKLQAPERKSKKVVKIVRREFIKANGQPREEIRYTVEQRGPGRPRRSAWKELEGLPEL